MYFLPEDSIEYRNLWYSLWLIRIITPSIDRRYLFLAGSGIRAFPVNEQIVHPRQNVLIVLRRRCDDSYGFPFCKLGCCHTLRS